MADYEQPEPFCYNLLLSAHLPCTRGNPHPAGVRLTSINCCCQTFVLQASLETIETEFWKVVEAADEPVEVLYGADIDTTITGSGFPQKVCIRCLLRALQCRAWTFAVLHTCRVIMTALLVDKAAAVQVVCICWLCPDAISFQATPSFLYLLHWGIKIECQGICICQGGSAAVLHQLPNTIY